MKIDSNWSARGYGEPHLRVEVKEMDKKTKTLESICSSDIEILSYVGQLLANNGEEIICFHEINKDTLKALTKTTVTLPPRYVKKSSLKGVLDDFIENGCMLRTDVPGKPIWIAPDRHIFNQLGFSGGGRFASLDPGLARNLALETQLVNHPEEYNLLLRQDDGYTKVFSISRGKFEYVSQQFFVDCISAFVDEQNDIIVNTYDIEGWKWTITGWELTHYRLTVRVENPELARYLLITHDVDISPTLVFVNSETGDSSLVCDACLTVDGSDSVTKTVRKRHVISKTYDMTQRFFDDCRYLPGILLDSITRIKELKHSPSKQGDFECRVSELGILDEETGKRGGKKEISRLIARESERSDYSDKTRYDVTRRILAIPGKVKKPWILAPLTGAIINSKGGDGV